MKQMLFKEREFEIILYQTRLDYRRSNIFRQICTKSRAYGLVENFFKTWLIKLIIVQTINFKFI